MNIFTGLLISILAGIIPTIIYAWFVWWLDHHEKEPWWLLALTFIWGATGAIILSIIIELILDIPISVLGSGLAYELAGASGVAPVVEEITKAFPLLFIFFFIRHELDSVLDGIVYGAMAGLGFAFSENVLYFMGSLQEGNLVDWGFVVFMRSILFGLNHALFTGLTGAGLALARLSMNKLYGFLMASGGLALGIIIHALHNFGATFAAINCLSIFISFGVDYGGIFMIAIVIILVLQQERKWIEAHLQPEVGSLIDAEAYEIISSPFKRFSVRLGLLFGNTQARQTRRIWGKLAQAGTNYAFASYQLAKFGDEGGSHKRREKLREEIQTLQQELLRLKT